MEGIILGHKYQEVRITGTILEAHRLYRAMVRQNTLQCVFHATDNIFYISNREEQIPLLSYVKWCLWRKPVDFQQYKFKKHSINYLVF